MVVKYLWTANVADGFDSEVQDEQFGVGYTFEDFLRDRDVDFYFDGTDYVVLDEAGERTSEAFRIISEVPEPIDVLMWAGATESEAKRHLNDGTTVLPLGGIEYNAIDYLDDNDLLDDEIEKFVEAGKDGRCGDCEIITYKGVQWFIDYVL